MIKKLSAMAAMFAFMSSFLANAKLYQLTGNGWYLFTLIIVAIGVVGSAAAMAIPNKRLSLTIKKLLAFIGFARRPAKGRQIIRTCWTNGMRLDEMSDGTSRISIFADKFPMDDVSTPG